MPWRGHPFAELNKSTFSHLFWHWLFYSIKLHILVLLSALAVSFKLFNGIRHCPWGGNLTETNEQLISWEICKWVCSRAPTDGLIGYKIPEGYEQIDNIFIQKPGWLWSYWGKKSATWIEYDFRESGQSFYSPNSSLTCSTDTSTSNIIDSFLRLKSYPLLKLNFPWRF